MRCELAGEVLLLESARYSADEASALEKHARACEECGALLRKLRAVRAVVAKDRVTIEPSARAEMRRRLARPPEATRVAWMVPAAIGAFAAAAAAIVFSSRVEVPDAPAPAEPVRAVFEARPGESVRIARGRVEAGAAGARFEIAGGELETSLFLRSGEVSIVLDPPAPGATFEVRTLDARINVLAERVAVTTSEQGTDVEVAGGTATMWKRGSVVPIAVHEQRSEKLLAVQTAEIAETGESGESGESAESGEPGESGQSGESGELEEPKSAARVAGAERFDSTTNGERGRSSSPAKATDNERARTLEAARAALPHDAPRAAELAESVLRQGARGELEAAALAVLADAERRRGLLRDAELTYAKVRDHARGAPYAEEAMLQRALLLAQLHDARGALDELARLETKFPSGVTTPERASLAAQLHLANGDVIAAAETITRARYEGVSAVLESRRLEVARVLVDRDPARTLALLRRALEHGAPSSMEAEMRELRSRAERALEK